LPSFAIISTRIFSSCYYNFCAVMAEAHKASTIHRMRGGRFDMGRRAPLGTLGKSASRIACR
jgi:hypothetical protein